MSAFKEQKEYKETREFVGIPKWQNEGYLGKGLSIFCDDVGGSHVELVADILKTILPEAEIYTGNFEFEISYGAVVKSYVRCDTTGEFMAFDDFMPKYNIRLINNSTSGYSGATMQPVGEFMRHRLGKYNMIMTGSCGNGYGQPINTGYFGAAILVTEVRLKEGNKVVSGKCAEGDGIDFSMFGGIMPGTSFASPYLLGMIGLILGKYPDFTQKQVYEYLLKCARPLGNSQVFGNGLPILPSIF